jgi:hypothetical protein
MSEYHQVFIKLYFYEKSEEQKADIVQTNDSVL